MSAARSFDQVPDRQPRPEGGVGGDDDRARGHGSDREAERRAPDLVAAAADTEAVGVVPVALVQS